MTNRDKYMKEIYKLIPDEYILNLIGVNKKTNKPFECTDSVRGKCDKCLFQKDGKCDVMAIYKWIKKKQK